MLLARIAREMARPNSQARTMPRSIPIVMPESERRNLSAAHGPSHFIKTKLPKLMPQIMPIDDSIP